MGLQSGAGSPMKGFLIILGLFGVSISKDPGVFKEYFDDSLRSVDVSQEVVLNSCLNDNGAASTKVNDAYGKCFGADYDFEELANNAGDNDGLPKAWQKTRLVSTKRWVGFLAMTWTPLPSRETWLGCRAQL